MLALVFSALLLALATRPAGMLHPTAGAVLADSPAHARQSLDALPPGMRIERLRERVHLVSGYENGNVLVVETADGLLLVDAQSAERVALADSAIRTVTARPVRLVINTHYHADHVGGNPHFRARGAVLVAHANVERQARKDTVIAEWNDWHRTPEPAEALPVVTFTDSLVLRLPGEEIAILHAPAAHTDGDAIIWLRRANVVHLGDLLELGAPPFLDWWAGGTPDGMIGAIDRVLGFADASTVIVPGHGPATDRAGLLAYRRMLQTVSTRVRDGIAGGKSLAEIVASRPTAEFDEGLGGEGRGRQLTALLHLGLSRGRARP